MICRLSKEMPSSETVLIDSNVLIYIHTRFPPNPQYENKQTVYSNVVGALLNKKTTLITTFLGVAEVFNYIERKAFEAYKEMNNLDDAFDKKDFRKLSSQRELIQKEIFQAYNEITQYYTFRDATFKRKMMDKFAITYLQHQYDPSDFIMTTIAEREQITEIITDDQDFYDDTRFAIYTY